MNREKYVQITASLLIALIMNFTLYTAFVYAAVNKVSVKGSDGVEGFAKASDTLEFSASVTLKNGTITNDQVYLAPDTKFDKCAASGTETVCTLKYPSSGKGSFQSRTITFTINLYKDTEKKQLDSSKSSSFVVDSRPPQVKLSSSKSTYSGQENIVINYEITDFGCADPACSSKCSGIKGAEFSTSDGSFKQSVAINTQECAYKSSINIEAKKFKDGKVNLIAKAQDALGQVSQDTSAEFTMDSTPPKILVETFAIMRKGVVINSYSPFSVGVEVFVDVAGKDLDPNSVTADFTPLNPTAVDVKATCSTSKADVFRCKWLIELNPKPSDSTGNPITTSAVTETTAAESTTKSDKTETKASPNSITITASDLIGNKATVSVSKSLTLDDKGPVVQSLSTGITKDDKFYSKPTGNTIIASLSDTTGLAKEDIFLRIDGAVRSPTSCKKEASFVCRWENVNFGSNKGIVSIEQDTTDILRNPVSEIKKIEVIVDGTPPVVNKINVTPIGSLSDSIIDLFKIGDKLNVVVNVTEENELTAHADFSKFIEFSKKVTVTCKRVQESWHLCTWISDTVNLSTTDKIKFLFNDSSGNEATAEFELKTLGLDISPQPDFWDNEIECSPKLMDRQLGPFINLRRYCQVKLKPKVQGVETLSISQADCKGTGKKFVKSVETINRQLGSTTPIVKLTLNKDEFKTNLVELNCSMGIVSRIGDRVTKNPEIESANLSIEFYNLPLGEVSENVQKKIDETKKDIKQLGRYIGTFSKIIAVFKKICQLYGIVYNLIAIKYTITIISKDTAVALCASILGAPACPGALAAGVNFCNVQQAARQKAQEGWKSANQFCKFVNCQWSPGVLGKWRSFMEKTLNSLPGSGYLPGGQIKYQPSQQFTTVEGFASDQAKSQAQQDKQKQDTQDKKKISDEMKGGYAAYMDPNNNLFVAAAFGCIPGIISGLEKIRQIKCLYADCLINAVAKDGLPATACEDLKSYTKCKFVTGEIFAFFPPTAFFDYLTGIVKEAFANPFSGGGAAISLMCFATCPEIGSAGYKVCETVKLFSQMGEIIGNIKNLANEGFKIRQDYCTRFDTEDENEEGQPTSSQPSRTSQPSQPSTPSQPPQPSQPQPNPQPSPTPNPSPTPPTNPNPPTNPV